jgi:chromosomal replication initiation ATPase DnaA
MITKTDRIIDLTCEYSELSKNDLLSSSRNQENVKARDFAIFFIRKSYGLSYENIAKIVNRLNHTSIMSSLIRHQDRMTFESNYCKDYNDYESFIVENLKLKDQI